MPFAIFLLIAMLTGMAFAIDDISSEDEEDLTTIIQGVIYTSNQSVTGNGLTSIYSDYAAVAQGYPDPVLRLRHLISGGGNYNHNSSIYIQNKIQKEDSELSSSNWKIEHKDVTRAVSSEIRIPISGSLRSKPIKLLWKDAAIARNYCSLADVNYALNRAIALDKESNIEVYSDCESFEEALDSDECMIGSSMKFKARFNGTGHIGMKFGSDEIQSKWLVDEDYRGSFAVDKKMSMNIEKKIVEDEYDSDFNDYPWLSCCTGGYFDMSLFDRHYISSGIFT